MKKIKLFEMFAGYGGASFALKRAGNGFDINLVSLIFKEMFKNGRNL